MKLTVHTSMRWIQQHLRYLAYMEDHGKEEQPPVSSPMPINQAESETTLTEADMSGLMGISNADVRR